MRGLQFSSSRLVAAACPASSYHKGGAASMWPPGRPAGRVATDHLGVRLASRGAADATAPPSVTATAAATSAGSETALNPGTMCGLRRRASSRQLDATVAGATRATGGQLTAASPRRTQYAPQQPWLHCLQTGARTRRQPLAAAMPVIGLRHDRSL
jgi:hypothetical protein